MRGAGAARGLPVVDLCLSDIFHSDTILPPSLPLVLCDQLGLLAISIFPLHPYILYFSHPYYTGSILFLYTDFSQVRVARGPAQREGYECFLDGHCINVC